MQTLKQLIDDPNTTLVDIFQASDNVGEIVEAAAIVRANFKAATDAVDVALKKESQAVAECYQAIGRKQESYQLLETVQRAREAMEKAREAARRYEPWREALERLDMWLKFQRRIESN